MKIVKRDFFYYSVLAMMSDKEPVKIQKVYNPFDSQCNDASTFELQSEGMNSFCLFIYFFFNKLRNLLFDWRHYGDKSKKETTVCWGSSIYYTRKVSKKLACLTSDTHA